jgi:hypothetical protein
MVACCDRLSAEARSQALGVGRPSAHWNMTNRRGFEFCLPVHQMEVIYPFRL